MADPRSSDGDAATRPAVSVADSAITIIEYAARSARTTAQCQRADSPTTMPLAPDAAIAIRIQRRRPTRSATSFPAMDAGTAMRFTTAAMVRIGDTIRNPPCQLGWHGLRIVSPDLWLVPGAVDQFLGQAHGDGGADGRGDLLPDRRFAARHLLRGVHGAADGDSQPFRLRRQLLPLARAVDRVAHPAEHQDQDCA